MNKWEFQFRSGKKYGLWYSSETYFCIQQYEIGGNFQEIILKDLPIQNSASTVKKSVANMDCFSDLRFLQKMPKILLRYITSSSGKIIKVDQFQTWMHEFHFLGGFQLLDLIIKELKSHMTCYNSMPLIGWNYSIQTWEQIL